MGGGYVRLRSSLHSAGEGRVVEMPVSALFCAKSGLGRVTIFASDLKEIMWRFYRHSRASSHQCYPTSITPHGRLPKQRQETKLNQGGVLRY
jgi:hypothetical protein